MSTPSTPLARLQIDRPLVFFDIESTGINVKTDRIIDLGIVRILPRHQREAFSFRVHPGMPIPRESSEVHGITDEDVEHCPPFSEVAERVRELFTDVDLAGFNILRFDIPLLEMECNRAGSPLDLREARVVDAQRIFHIKEPRDLSAALKFYCGEFHLDAHGAMGDVDATIRVLDGQLERYGDLPRSVDGLHELCDTRKPDWVDRSGKLRWANGDILINFGKNKGQSLKTLVREDPGFLSWMLRSDFPPDTQDLIRNAMSGRFPDPPQA